MGKQARLKRISPGVEQEEEKVPKSFVLRKGDVGYTMRILIGDVRRVMLPNTALNLQEKSQNKLKDFQNVAGPLGVSHFMIFSTTTQGTNYLRISKSPQGPTLTFKVTKYCLTKDVTQSQKNPHSPSFEFKFAPLVVLNNFSAADSHMQIMSTMLQSLFPSINVQKVSLTDCKRVVMLEYDKETGEIEFRHYLITTVPVGASKSVKKIINRKAIPNLSQYDDISDFLTQDTTMTESDVEDGAEVRVDVPQSKKKQKAVHQMAVRLKELGPRMQMKLMKIQAGFCDGDILYRHEEDTSGVGGDDSLKVKVKKSEEEKEKEEERTESLRPKMPKFANKKMPKIPKKKAPETAKSKLQKRKMEQQESFDKKDNKGGKSGSKQGSNNGPPHKKRKF